ncbi:MAG: endopeptidase La [Bacillota bacterium]
MEAKSRRQRSKVLPLLPLRGMLVFPYMVVHLDVGREKSIAAVEAALEREDRLVALVAQRDVKLDQPGHDDLYQVGTIAEVKQMLRLPGGTIRVLVEGFRRARLQRFLPGEAYCLAEVAEVPEPGSRGPQVEALMRTAVQLFESYTRLGKRVPAETLMSIVSVEEPGRLADTLAAHLTLKVEDKQAILEATGVGRRLEAVIELLQRELEILELERKISTRVRKQMERTQREYYLREQLKAIHKELGERDDKGDEAQDYRARIAKSGMTPEAQEKALRELERLEKMPPMSAEGVVTRTYLDWLLALPWAAETVDQLDIDKAEGILHEDHYGLDKVKERILEYLAVRRLVERMKGPILCLVGPPGVGKTSLAKSIARSLDRKFVRISLGGVRDEAEIRGHRRTYVGALPGRIIQGMRQASSRNPVFLMDEIDKMSADFRGDPASALLEVLDPEQNSAFSDHYVEAAFDLSKVLFITTANTLYNIPRPLLDRMETIIIPGYTEEEKLEIGRRHILPKLLTEHGLKPSQLRISAGGIRGIIRAYTRESGVRNLERELAAICRKAAVDVVRGKHSQVRVGAHNLVQYLGAPRYRTGEAEDDNEVGVAMGVAVTEAGGEIMPIEAALMNGKGTLMLTGKLGEVMRESAQAGFSYIRSRQAALGIEAGFHERLDIHVHIPEGAIPKDGPSAGITMATAVVSALTKRPVRRDVAMTGEITLRGQVLPIGGMKEKVLAAHRAGIKTVVLPEANRKDLEEIPMNVRRKLEFVMVGHMDDVLRTALVGGLDAVDPALLPLPVEPQQPRLHVN